MDRWRQGGCRRAAWSGPPRRDTRRSRRSSRGERQWHSRCAASTRSGLRGTAAGRRRRGRSCRTGWWRRWWPGARCRGRRPPPWCLPSPSLHSRCAQLARFASDFVDTDEWTGGEDGLRGWNRMLPKLVAAGDGIDARHWTSLSLRSSEKKKRCCHGDDHHDQRCCDGYHWVASAPLWTVDSARVGSHQTQ